jgi:hypothetical protein
MLAVSAPVVLARIFWSRRLPYSWDWGLWLAGLALFWYWVACSIETWREEHEALVVRWRYGRLAIDLLLIAVSLVLGLLGAGEIKQIVFWAPSIWGSTVGCFGATWWSEFLRALIVGGLYLGWCGALFLVFGRDLARCLRNVSVDRKSAS